MPLRLGAPAPAEVAAERASDTGVFHPPPPAPLLSAGDGGLHGLCPAPHQREPPLGKRSTLTALSRSIQFALLSYSAVERGELWEGCLPSWGLRETEARQGGLGPIPGTAEHTQHMAGVVIRASALLFCLLGDPKKTSLSLCVLG